MTRFEYDPALIARYPTLVGGIVSVQAVRNMPTPPALLALYRAEQQAALARIGDTPLSQIPSLAAWRTVFRSFGVDPTQIRSAAEALLRRLTKQGEIPSINLLVDLGNLVSIRYALPVAVFDMRSAAGAIRVHFAKGSEPFTNLNAEQAEFPEVGEVIFSDEQAVVYARRWCWRQSDQSAARETTRDALVTVEAHHAEARADIEKATADLIALLQEYAGGTLTSAILNLDRRSM